MAITYPHLSQLGFSISSTSSSLLRPGHGSIVMIVVSFWLIKLHNLLISYALQVQIAPHNHDLWNMKNIWFVHRQDMFFFNFEFWNLHYDHDNAWFAEYDHDDDSFTKKQAGWRGSLVRFNASLSLYIASHILVTSSSSSTTATTITWFMC